MKNFFDHEKLNVYRESIAFCGWVGDFVGTIKPKAAVKDQLDRCSTSVPLNIAEGTGKFSPGDRSRFFEIARGSAAECAACLDVLVVRKLATEEEVAPRKEQLVKIVQMLVGLLRKFSPRAGTIREGEVGYAEDYEHDYDYEHDAQPK